MSPPRTTTYYYNPKTNELLTRQAYDYLTVAAAPLPASPPMPSLSYCSTAPTTPSSSPQTPTTKMVRTRAVNFGAVEGAREPFHDERYVFKSFNSHAKRCDDCYDSLYSGHSDLPLCSDGYGLYVDMGPYFYCSGGKPYSSVEREKYGEKNRILVPHEMTHVSALFEALDRGYAPKQSRHTSRPKPIIVQPQSPVKSSTKSTKTVHFSRYDDPDVVIVPADRRRHRDRERYYEERRQQSNTEKPYVVQRQPRRGSLYYEDEQRRHRHGERVIIVPADQVYYRT